MSHSDDDLITYNHPYFQEFELVAQVCAGASAVGSLTVVLTAFLFPSLWRKKIYMQMVVMAAGCDWVGSTFAAFGFPTDDELCSIQSHMTMFFLRASYIWIFFITLKLYLYMKFNWDGLNMLEMNLICWSIGTLLQGLPYISGMDYGEDDHTAGYQPCVFHKNHLPDGYSVGDMWFTFVWYVPKLIIITLLVFMIASMWQVKWAQLQAAYPFALSVLCFPNIIMSAIENYGPMNQNNFGTVYILVNVTYCWNLMYGLVMAVIFWCNSIETRRRWQLALVELGCMTRPTTPLVAADTSRDTGFDDSDRNTSSDHNDQNHSITSINTSDITFKEHEMRATMGGDMMDIDFDMTDFDTYRMPLFRRMLGWRLPPDPNSENNNGDTIPTKRQEMSPKQRLESLEEEL